MTTEQTQTQPETRPSEVRSDALLGCPFCGSPCKCETDEEQWPVIVCTNRDCYATVSFQNAEAWFPNRAPDWTATMKLFNERHPNPQVSRDGGKEVT
jgi:hypothetical protein